MPWRQVTPMSEKKEFIYLAQGEGGTIFRLCRYFQVSRKTAYKWLGRYRREGEAGLQDRSRRPRSSPGATPVVLEAAVLQVREAQPGPKGLFCPLVLCYGELT